MATSSTSWEEDRIDVLYPDLLSREGLLHTLRKRYVQISDTDLESLDKESLVELYNQYILPLPQRKHTDNFRGRELKKAQIKRDKKRRLAVTVEDELTPVTKKGRLSQDSPGPAKGLVNHFTTSPVGDRLKPPPSCIDTSKKTVKLSSSSSSSSTLSLSVKKQDSEKNSAANPSPKVIKFSDNGKPNNATKRQVDETKEEDNQSPKKKISKISWP